IVRGRGANREIAASRKCLMHLRCLVGNDDDRT
ncbi:MAG: hypothetical protein V7604_5150, partial [Hyphomicrobiales bacterium]